MEQSILKSTKQILGISPDDDSFDLDIITHINSAFFTLHQLGIGPVEGFAIEDDQAVWDDFITGDILQVNQAKTCVRLRVRLAFDPPATTFHLSALEKQLEECEWRLNVNREETEWVDPNPSVPLVGDDLPDPLGPAFDGGSA